MFLLDFQKMFTLEELFCYQVQLSPLLLMAKINYTENELRQGIKSQDQSIFIWLYQTMAPQVKSNFERMGLSTIAGKNTYTQLFEKAMLLLRKDLRYDKVGKNLRLHLTQLLQNLCAENFIDEASVKQWLSQNCQAKIEKLTQELNIHPVAEDATELIFEKVYDYIKNYVREEKYKTGQLNSVVDYTVRVKTVDHYLLDHKTWTWLDQHMRRLTINSYLYLVKQRSDISCEEVFNDSLDDAWNSVKMKKYTPGENIFEYLRRIYRNKLLSLVGKKKKEILSGDPPPLADAEIPPQVTMNESFSTATDQRLSKEILLETMIKALEGLKPDQRDLIYDFKFAGKSLIQIAKERNYQEKSMKVLNSRAHKALLNLYFQRLLGITQHTIDEDCLTKLKNKSLKVKDQAVDFCRKELKRLAQKIIQSFLQGIRQIDPNLSEEDTKAFIHFIITRRLHNDAQVSLNDLSKWKLNKNYHQAWSNFYSLALSAFFFKTQPSWIFPKQPLKLIYFNN